MSSFFKMFRSSSHSASKPRLGLDCFEARTVPAVVTATLSPAGLLSLTADDAASVENLTISNVGVTGNVRVTGGGTGSAATTVKYGTAAPDATKDFGGVTSINVVLKGGADVLKVDQLTIRGNLSVNGGDGGNTINIGAFMIGGSLSILNGNGGTDAVVLNGAYIGKNLTVNQGRGADPSSIAIVNGSRVGGSVRVVGGAAADQVTLSGPSIGNALNVSTGLGDDSLDILSSTAIGGTVNALLGDGNNTMNVNTANVYGAFSYKGGLGVDTVILTTLRVHGNASVVLGEGKDSLNIMTSDFSTNLSVNLGNGDNTFTFDHNNITLPSDSTSVLGNFSLIGGTGSDIVIIGGDGGTPYFLGTTSISLGSETTGGDQLSIDDAFLVGAVNVDLGGGDDKFLVETSDTKYYSQFSGKLTVLAGSGNDTVTFGVAGNSGKSVKFGVAPVVDGGQNKLKKPVKKDVLSRGNMFIAGKAVTSSDIFFKNFEDIGTI